MHTCDVCIMCDVCSTACDVCSTRMRCFSCRLHVHAMPVLVCACIPYIYSCTREPIHATAPKLAPPQSPAQPLIPHRVPSADSPFSPPSPPPPPTALRHQPPVQPQHLPGGLPRHGLQAAAAAPLGLSACERSLPIPLPPPPSSIPPPTHMHLPPPPYSL